MTDSAAWLPVPNPSLKTESMDSYLEIHRIDRSKEFTLTNCVAICPNCHRMITCLQDDQMNKVLQEKASHHTESSLFEQQQP